MECSFTSINVGGVDCGEINRGAFEGVESSFSLLRSSVQSLVFFWCTHTSSNCIEDLMFVENHFFL